MRKKTSKRVHAEMCCRGEGIGQRKGKRRNGVVAMNKALECKEMKVWNNRVMEVRITFNFRDWRIFIVYSQNVAEAMDEITNGMEETKEECLIIGEDFNERTGEEGGPIRRENEKEDKTRNSKDKIINKEGKILIEKLTERGWAILNGVTMR